MLNRVTYFNTMSIAFYYRTLQMASANHLYLEHRDVIITKLNIFKSMNIKYKWWTKIGTGERITPLFSQKNLV